MFSHNSITSLIISRFLFLTGFQTSRQKRKIIKSFIPCDENVFRQELLNCKHLGWDILCKMRTGSCYYLFTCENLRHKFPGRDEWECKDKHIRNQMPSCCDYTCH